jgi:hypothetical protein
MTTMGEDSRITAMFGLIGFVVLAVGHNISAYRLSLARRGVIGAGEVPSRVTLRSVSGEDDEER